MFLLSKEAKNLFEEFLKPPPSLQTQEEHHKRYRLHVLEKS